MCHANWQVPTVSALTLLSALPLEASLPSGLNETTQSGASSVQDTGVGLQVDHELLRNLILSASADYDRSEFDDIGRTDDTIALGADAKYLLNRRLISILAPV